MGLDISAPLAELHIASKLNVPLGEASVPKKTRRDGKYTNEQEQVDKMSHKAL